MTARGLNMTMELYQEVSLTRDLPEYGLRAGDIATLVDFVPHPNNGEEGCVLEIFKTNSIGKVEPFTNKNVNETIACLSVTILEIT
jgi:hypothetical protein